MINIRMFSIINDGTSKRLTATYDVIDEEGNITKTNVKVNKVIVDNQLLKEIKDVEDYCQKIIAD